eukprot:SAG25_NODE_2953_length_1299_cov_3.707439_3_plen_33_part_01
MSGSGLRSLCREAAMMPVHEYIAAQEQQEQQQQ